MRRAFSGGVIVAAAAVACALAAGCRSGAVEATQGKPEAVTRQVRVAAAERGAMPRRVSVTGTLAAEEQVSLGMKVAGRLSVIEVDLGSRAVKGQVLARLVSTDFQLRVEQAQAALQQARSRLGLPEGAPDARVDPAQTSLVRQASAVLEEARLNRDRSQKLFDDQLVARSTLDAAMAAFQVAEAKYQDALEEILNRQGMLAQRRTELDIAQQQLSDAVLTAPYDGAVRERQASPGQFVASGQPVVTLVRLHPLRLRLAVPERDAAGVREGQEVHLTVEGDEKGYSGRVARLSPVISEGSRTLMVEAEVPNQNGALKPGSFATAEILTSAAQPVLFVPASSIVTFAGIEKVIMVKDGKAVEKRVHTGRRADDRVEILDGIEPGDQVVVEPGNLVAGQAVSVAG
jgi:RND family efflux transporter MFP subunit